ncbi:MAG: DMT family transporter [Methanophagales archaeon]|nr:DMT family transporter [Methanophagales archaeon]
MLGVSMIMIKAFLIFFIFPLIGVLAICLGIWHERKKEVERRGRGWKYLMFSIIGILSFFAGFYLGDEMQLGYLIFKATGGLLAIFPFALIIYALLFLVGLYISKEHSFGFGLKVFGISFLFLFLAFQGIMAYGAHEHYYAKYISVRTLSAPSDYINLTAEELERYPAIKEAIEQAEKNKMGVVSLHPNEWQRIETSLGRAWLHTIKIGDEYYKIEFHCSLASKKLPEVPERYANVTEEDLEEYSILKRGKELADKFADRSKPFKMSISLDEWLRIEDFLDKKGVRTIEFGEEYYEFELISNLIVQKYYANITEEELEEYPALKKVIEDANRSENGRAGLKVHPDEWGRIGVFLDEKGSHNIKVGDEYYGVGFICA